MLDNNVPAVLILENGMRFPGKAFGHVGGVAGELVFTTGMGGYQETLTDPSCAGRIVVMTYPLIGNYGINLEDMESDSPKVAGFIVKEKCDAPSNWRCEMDLDGFLKQHGIAGLEGVDTRALTKVIRDNGTLRGVLTTDDSMTDASAAEIMASCTGSEVARVTAKERYSVNGSEDSLSGKHICVLDLGLKRSVLNELAGKGHKITVFPAFANAEEILSAEPDAVFISNGPGDPKDIPQVVTAVRELMDKKPIVGICLGCQVLGLAMGCDTERMKFGHHGGNYPVKSVDNNRVYITSQSHEYVLTSLPGDVEASFVNVNDNTIEGIRHKSLPLAGIQFYPEAAPGPNDTSFFVHDFLGSI